MIASAKGFPEVVGALLDACDDPAYLDQRNCRGRSALWMACSFGRTSCVRVLLARGADFNLADDDGQTPIQEARRWRKEDCLAAIQVGFNKDFIFIISGGEGVV